MLILFVHGALVRDADWWWHRMPGPLADRGLPTAAVELPSCVGPGDLAADAEAVRSAVAAADGPVTLVGHSYGGTVVTEGGAGAAHLVYLTSFLTPVGESHAQQGGGAPAPWVRPGPDGTLELAGPDLEQLFFHDCADEFDAALARTARQDARALTRPVTSAAWTTVPSTYVVCAEDRATPAAVQRAAAERAGAVVELPTGHHPFLSRPELLADMLAGLG